MHKSWQLLSQLASQFSLPWLCFDDFNKLLNSSENEGGACRPIRQMLEFREAIRNVKMEDLWYDDNPFIWFSTRNGGIKERLDRALANFEWQLLFLGARVIHLEPNN